MKLKEQFEGLFVDGYSIVKTLMSILKIEIKLARLSVYPLLINLVLLLVILLSLWFLMMVSVGYLLMGYLESLGLVLLSVITLQLILLFCILQYLKYNLKNISFEKTCAYFSNEGVKTDDPLKKTVARQAVDP
jgi:hypothetical protein